MKRKFIVVSHTHWDREWYQPFEAFRARLVRMMDALIELFERDPGFKHFALDGQTVPLDDYLEIRPDRRAVVEKLVRDGKLLIGPNYMLPDEFLIGAEAWVRNLMVGIRSARGYGGAMMVGYSPDAFGHIAYLPAILNGFGIDSVVIWRGVGREATTSEFRWAAPDGSEVLAVHFPTPGGYGYMSEVPADEQALANALHNMRTSLEPYATTRVVLVPNGTDHLPAREGLSEIIRSANAIMPDAKMTHGSYPAFVKAVRKELGAKYGELPRLEGEFRDSSRSNVIAGVLSTRMWLKQRYAHCEDLLARYAEPLAAWAHSISVARGEDDPDATASTKALLGHAWKLLLQNGPHDSVTGCGVDAVYEDDRLRFDKAEQIAESVLYEAHGEVARMAAKAGEETVAVYNSENGPRTDIATVRLSVRDGLPAAMRDADGNETPVQVIERGGTSPLDKRERVLAAFVASGVPGFGYKAYTPVFGGISLPGVSAGRSIENETFRVTGEDDGTLTVEDKRSGHALRRLNRFEDSGEKGDEYTYSPPDKDELVGAPKSPAQVSVTEAGPVRWTLEVRQTYSVPARIADGRNARSDVRVDIDIVSRVRLYPGVARIDIETEVENRAEDHRLRALFPSALASEDSHAEQHFGVVRRSTKAAEYDETWYERPVNTHPQKTFVDVTNNGRGLMIANRGLPEYEAFREDDGTATVALTLLRCISWLSRDDLPERPGHAGPGMYTPGAQMLGRWTFEYSIIAHAGTWQNAYAEAHRFARPLRAARVSGGRGEWPAERSLLAIDHPQAVMSAAKQAEDDEGTVVRVYNIGDEAIEAKVTLEEPHGKTRVTDMNEENARGVKAKDGAVPLELRPNQIVTLKFDAPA